jgi:hypothetical protein
LAAVVEEVITELITPLPELERIPIWLAVEGEVPLGRSIPLVQVVLVLNVKVGLVELEALLVGGGPVVVLVVMLDPVRALKIQSQAVVLARLLLAQT